MMKKNLFLPFFSVLIIVIISSGCDTGGPALSLEQQYDNAVRDAVFAEAYEICGNLIVISEDNADLEWDSGMVLVVTFTRFPDSYSEGEIIETWWGDTWVTAVPELQIVYDSIAHSVDDPLLRIEQLLGLPMDTGSEWFVELWVNPDDLFRPCPDNEITDSACELSFPDDATGEHIDWFNNQIIESYYHEQQYPWTRLGYTYDWDDSTSEIGLSEFIIRQGAEVVVERVESYEEYLSMDI